MAAARRVISGYGGDVSRLLEPALVDLFLSTLASGTRAALLVRHAERGPVTDLARHHEVLLTPAGVEAARVSGQQLTTCTRHGRPVFAHSPVERCGQTARALHEGAGVGDVAGVIDDLGSNYLRDPARVAQAYLEGGRDFVRAWFDGRVDDGIIAPCDVVARLQIDAMTGLLQQHDIVVAVSHDWNIAALREHALGARFEDVGWPEFLDGVVVTADGEVRCLKAARGPGHPLR
jgi:broad specificity phosphatase PhoE